jgi:alcohol dehydrogenase class IV
MPHGLSIALLLPHVFAFNSAADPARHAAIALALGASRGATDMETALRGAMRIHELCTCCGIKMSLTAHGVAETSIGIMSATAMRVERLLRNNPRKVGIADAEEIYRRAL